MTEGEWSSRETNTKGIVRFSFVLAYKTKGNVRAGELTPVQGNSQISTLLSAIEYNHYLEDFEVPGILLWKFDKGWLILIENKLTRESDRGQSPLLLQNIGQWEDSNPQRVEQGRRSERMR